MSCPLQRHYAGVIGLIGPYIVETLTVEGDWVPANAQYIEHDLLDEAVQRAITLATDGAPKRVRSAGWAYGEAIYLSRAGV